MYDLAYFQTIAEQMIAADRERDRLLRAMDDMWHNRWALPPNVAGLKWIHKVVSSDPHDAIRAGTRVLSSVAPRPYREALPSTAALNILAGQVGTGIDARAFAALRDLVEKGEAPPYKAASD